MTDEEKNATHTTRMVHIKDAAEKLQPYLEEFLAGKMPPDDFHSKFVELIPDITDIGTTMDEEKDEITINTKPVPENPGATLYFYLDSEGVLQCTLRLNRYEDNQTFSEDSEDRAELDEACGLDFIKLVQMEHNEVIKSAVMRAMVERMGGVPGMTDSDTPEGDDPLEGIEDESVKEQVRKFLH